MSLLRNRHRSVSQWALCKFSKCSHSCLFSWSQLREKWDILWCFQICLNLISLIGSTISVMSQWEIDMVRLSLISIWVLRFSHSCLFSSVSAKKKKESSASSQMSLNTIHDLILYLNHISVDLMPKFGKISNQFRQIMYEIYGLLLDRETDKPTAYPAESVCPSVRTKV